MKPLLLGVNIDHVATLRQARGTLYPDLIKAAISVKEAGADSITVHLREDRRHIQDRDVHNLREQIALPLNLEMAITDEMLDIATLVKPDYCCFVPEKREELTTEGGLDVILEQDRVSEACKRMSDVGILTSLFIDADPEQIRAASASGASVVEIHTGQYADKDGHPEQQDELRRIVESISLAVSLGLKVNAGHGLNYENVSAIAAIQDIHELNIGHAIIAQSVFYGLKVAVRDIRH
jgi:pyridoxine 5-phosphate synthase